MKVLQTAEKIGRAIFIAFWSVWHFFLSLFAVAFIQEQVEPSKWLILLCCSAFCSALVWLALSTMPDILLSADGVRVRVLFFEHFHPWDTIKQAGILYRMGRGMRYNQIVLLKANGSPRQYQDKTFLLRNIGKKIPIPYSEDAKNYIIRYYGPLDFDLSDGRAEKVS